MIRLRKFILAAFWLVPFVYGIAALSVPFFISLIPSQSTCDDSPVPYCSLLLPLARGVILLFAVTPIAICFTSVGALLQYHRSKLSARSWAMACGASFLVAGTVITGAEIFIFYLESTHPDSFVYNGPRSSTSHFPIFGAIHLAVGILIVLAFRPRTSISEIISAEDRPVKVKGDGTTSLSYLVAIIVVFVGLSMIESRVSAWGSRHGLQQTSGFLLGQLIFFGALYISVAAHELGHILAGFSVGMKLLSVRVGPLHMQLKEGHWQMILPESWKCVFQAGVLVVPPNPNDYSKAHAVWRSAGGPLASLATGGLALLALFGAKGSFYESIWELLALIAATSIVAFLVNLIPLREASQYSDGAHIYQILTGNVMADYRRVAHLTQATKITSIRPRDYDITLIENTAANGTLEPRVTAFLCLVAGDCYFDQGRMDEARAAISRAEAAAEHMSTVPKEYCDWLVVRAVCFAGNRELAEKWWNRGLQAKPLDSKRDSEFQDIAYNLIENRLSDAEGAWKRQFERTNKLPDTGERAFDFYYLMQLRRLLDETLATSGEQALESPMKCSSSMGA